MPFLILYSIFYRPLIFLVSIFSLFNKKVQKGFKLRRKIKGTPPWLNSPQNTQPIWFHCSSGEYEYAKPVIRLIKQKKPQQKIMVSFFSPSVEKSLAESEDVDFYCPTPWDTAKNWREFIEYHKPKALLIARTDLWPMMIHISKKKKVPTLLFSKSVNIQKKGIQNWISHLLMKRLTEIFCVTEEDRKVLYQRIKPYQNIHAAGDTRYDQCLYRLSHGKQLKALNNFLRPIFIAGSTWPSDEKVILPGLVKKLKSLSIIIAPHEPTETHLKELEKQLNNLGVKSQRYSTAQSWDPLAVLLIDQVGILADLYKWGQFAFVGGSMDRSVHSVMEPLSQGLLTFVGPKHLNNREALTFKQKDIKGIQPVQTVKNSVEFEEKLKAALSLWEQNHQFELRLEVKKKTGASQIVLQWLENSQPPASTI